MDRREMIRMREEARGATISEDCSKVASRKANAKRGKGEGPDKG